MRAAAGIRVEAVVRDDPHGLLLVQNGSRVDFVVDRLARRAPELARRLVVVPSSLSHRDFLALLRACAAVLDLFPFPPLVFELRFDSNDSTFCLLS